MLNMLKSILLGRGSRIVGLTLLAVAGVASLPAASITGGFGITGLGVVTFTTGGTHFIDFCPTDPTSPPTSPSCVGAANYGLGDVIAVGGTGTFTAVNPATAATIVDMRDTAGPGPFIYFPVGIPSMVDNFLVLSALPTLNFQAQMFVPQTCIPSATQLCIGGFSLAQIGQNVSVSATINGVVSDTSGVLGPASFTDILTGQFLNTNLAAVAAGAGSPGGVFSNTWSNSVITSPIPEPATFGMLGGALVLLSSMARRRFVRKG